MAYQVLKKMHLSYGHRLMKHAGKCARLHGHNGCVEVEVGCESLDEQGMVVDFYEIKEKLQKWIDEHLDHRMILYKEDPLVKVLQEKGEEIVVTEEHPTAEHLAKLIFDAGIEAGLKLKKVCLWETPDSAACYSNL